MNRRAPPWAQVHLKTVMTMIKSRLGEKDPCAAIVAAMLEIGDANQDMADRMDEAADKTIEAWNRATNTIATAASRAAADTTRQAELRDRRFSRRIIASVVAATVLLGYLVETRDGGNACRPAAPMTNDGATQQ